MQRIEVVKSRSSARALWRLANQPAPSVRVTGYADRQDGVTEYLIATRFGDGPTVVVRHRFSDFVALHHKLYSGIKFPVAKSLFALNEALKEQRVVELGKYLAEVVTRSIERLSTASDPVFGPDLQDFLGARDIDVGRLDSLRASGSSSEAEALTLDDDAAQMGCGVPQKMQRYPWPAIS